MRNKVSPLERGKRAPSYARDQRIVDTNNQGESFTFPADADDFDDAACEAAFEGLPNIDDVACSRGLVGGFGGASFDIRELNQPQQVEQGSLVRV